jgi:putative nucleotidyltransferase with HDIG domain
MLKGESREIKGRILPAAVTVGGITLWLVATLGFFARHAWQEQATVFALMPLVIVSGMFPNILPLPSGLKLSREKMSFTLSDALVLLIACHFGFAACVFVAGIEGLTSSRRAVRRLSSNLYSLSMMSVASAAAAASLRAVLRYGFGEGSGTDHAFQAIAVAMLVASIVHIVANTGIISLLFATRLGTSFLSSWKENFLLAAPMFLPTSAAASMMYIALSYNALTVAAIGAPILIAIYFGHRRYRDSLQEQVNLIERAQQERITLLEKAHLETIEALAVTINAKDEVTHDHVLRVQIYAAGVARLLGCSQAEIEALKAGALLHDIGKIAVPDYIINKPGKLTAAEFEKMKTHTLVGAQILGRVAFPYPIVPVVRHHHERWDGQGYPDGLAGEAIPLTARILTVVDCFDAVREDRQYRKGMTREEAIEYLLSNSGTQYDPRVVGTFITHLPEFEAEIRSHRNAPAPTFGIEPVEQLSEAARLIAPAAGLAAPSKPSGDTILTTDQRASLSALARLMSEARDPDEVIRTWTTALKALVPYDSCTVTLAPSHREQSIAAHAFGEHAALLGGRRIIPGEGVTGWVLANLQSFYNADPRLDLPPELAAQCAAYRTLAACPILRDAEMHGVITLYSTALAKYEDEHTRLLEEAAGLLAAALRVDAPKVEPVAATSARPTLPGKASATDPLFSDPAINLSEVVLESELAH